ncbi:MAG: hypothetical protein PHF56_18305 [Desulfuromonadaceae bacterium]|nr:hypothetical protein [Desulfuromonadaceae bacterium]
MQDGSDAPQDPAACERNCALRATSHRRIGVRQFNLCLTPAEEAAIVAFLKTLTDINK